MSLKGSTMTTRQYFFGSALCLIASPLLLSSCLNFNSLFSCENNSMRQEWLLADAYEPNDTPDQASPISTELTATLNGKDKPDFYSFQGDANTYVRFQIERLSGAYLGSNLEIRDATGVSVKNPPDAAYGINPKAYLVRLPRTGGYTLQVAGDYNGPADSFCANGVLGYRLRLERFNALEAPVVSVQKRTEKQVTFAWKAVDGASGYVVELLEKPDTWAAVNLIDQEVTDGLISATFNSYLVGTQQYRVRASFGGLLSDAVVVRVDPFVP
jgi:hypothetical protein